MTSASRWRRNRDACARLRGVGAEVGRLVEEERALGRRGCAPGRARSERAACRRCCSSRSRPARSRDRAKTAIAALSSGPMAAGLLGLVCHERGRRLRPRRRRRGGRFRSSSWPRVCSCSPSWSCSSLGCSSLVVVVRPAATDVDVWTVARLGYGARDGHRFGGAAAAGRARARRRSIRVSGRSFIGGCGSLAIPAASGYRPAGRERERWP